MIYNEPLILNNKHILLVVVTLCYIESSVARFYASSGTDTRSVSPGWGQGTKQNMNSPRKSRVRSRGAGPLLFCKIKYIFPLQCNPISLSRVQKKRRNAYFQIYRSNIKTAGNRLNKLFGDPLASGQL